MECRLGQVLVEQGVLTDAQVKSVLQHQQETGEPFGLVCERLFRIDADVIERAWAVQYSRLTRTIDPSVEYVEPAALELVTRRQAWQFRILPVRFDGHELMLATTPEHLRRALRFAVNVIGIPVFLVMSDPGKLGMALCKYYELPGMDPASVQDDRLDQIVRNVA